MSELAKKLLEQNPDLFTRIQVGEYKPEELDSFLEAEKSPTNKDALIAEIKSAAYTAPPPLATASDRAEAKQEQEKNEGMIQESAPVVPVIPGKPPKA